METPTPKIGKNILEMMMFNMYDECKVIYREYIQNSFDAIQQAVSTGILSSVNEGIVNVTIDDKNRNVIFSDNGIGISALKAGKTLRNVAVSEKDGNQAGKYGVGRLVGAGFCKRIIFRTKAKGEPKGTEVTIDSDLAYSIIRDRNDVRDAVEVMIAISTVKEIECKEDHFFEVTLEEIKEGYDELLSEKYIREYLSSVAPVDYSLPFKNMLINKCPMFVERYSSIKYVRIVINNKDLKKNYGLKIIGNNDDILRLDVFDIKDDEQVYAWGWIAITPFAKAIPEIIPKTEEPEPNRGIRLRINNIQIGDAKLLDKFFRESRGNHYFYGEIHVTNKEIVPDSTRQGLAATTEALYFHDLLRKKFYELYKLYHLANDLKIAVRDLGIAVKKEQSEDENVDKVQAQSEVKKALSTIERAETKDITSDGAGHTVLQYYKEQSQNVQNSGGSVMVEPVRPRNHVASVVPTDELSPLASKFSIETIKVIKKIFALFRKKSTDKASLENIIEDIIKQLSK